MTRRRDAAGPVGCALTACLLPWLVLPLVGLASGDPPENPLRVWGQIVGDVPASLVAQLSTPPGSSLAALTATATIRTTGGVTYYTAEWPAGPALDLIARSARLSLESPDGSSADALPISTAASWPFQVNLVNGRPALPTSVIAVARAELSTGTREEYLFVAVVARTDGRTVPGRISWRPWEGMPLVTTAFTANGGVTVSRLTTPVPHDEEPPSTWEVEWVPTDPLEPRTFQRVSLRDGVLVLADQIGEGPDLPEAPPLERRRGGLVLFDHELKLSPGDWLSLELEASLGSASQVRAELANGSITSAPRSDGSRGIGLPLRGASVVDLPDGKVWVNASFECTRSRTIRKLTITGPAGDSPRASWTLRRLVRFLDHSRKGGY
ncbi:MAG: hypothetical protein HY815_12300 [Candidatus Riflebacteria bacterium]|nr:hypothetical protein [Candidatus Riflebacteria bacterium]